ncbi:MAG: hypothetical protein LBU97_02235, partial [Alistipes sp.]|nr:hypothetical protein [Alistipes sp.]
MSNNNNRPWSVRLPAALLYGACQAVGSLPHRFLYGPLAGSMRFLLHRVAHYRLRVVRDNLASSFPERPLSELRSIERG